MCLFAKEVFPLQWLLTALSWILKLLTFYTGVMGLCFLLPRKRIPQSPAGTRFAVLIPARNEQAVIGNLIAALGNQTYPRHLYDILVIPNNCTDATEQVARDAGAGILHCSRPVHTKGQVLQDILGQLQGQYDAYVVFDADNLPNPEFLARMHDAVADGAQVAKSRQMALNPYDSWVSGSYDLYFQSIHLMHSLGRIPFRLSAKLIGTGFMVTDRLLQTLGGWNTCTLTEDIEFAAQCAQRGVQVRYVPEAINYDEEPVSFRVSMLQRRRWSAGVQQVANRYTLPLLRRRGWLCWDLAAHINMIYVQLLAIFPAVYGLLQSSITQAAASLLITVAGFWAGSTAMGLFLAISARRKLLPMLPVVLLYPLFLLSWYPLHIWGLFSKPKNWVPIPHGTTKQAAVNEKISL